MDVLPILGQHKTVRKYLGITNCLPIAATSYKNCFQYAGVPLTDVINETVLSLAANHSVAPLKLFKLLLLLFCLV